MTAMAAIDKARSSRIGFAGTCRILADLREPRSTDDLMKRHTLCRDAMRKLLRHLRHVRLIHRCDWYRPNPKSRMVPRWLIGGDGDVPDPCGERWQKACRPSPTVITLATVVEVLSARPTSSAELAEELAMFIDTAYRYLSALRAVGLVRVGSWGRPDRGRPYAEWVFGPGADASRPRPNLKLQAKRHKENYHGRRRQIAFQRALAGQAAPHQPRVSAQPESPWTSS